MSMRSLPSGVPFWKKSVANAWSSAFAAFRVREAWILRKVRSRPVGCLAPALEGQERHALTIDRRDQLGIVRVTTTEVGP